MKPPNSGAGRLERLSVKRAMTSERPVRRCVEHANQGQSISYPSTEQLSSRTGTRGALKRRNVLVGFFVLKLPTTLMLYQESSIWSQISTRMCAKRHHEARLCPP
eukprot:2412147-Prymnesium_polylepis.1